MRKIQMHGSMAVFTQKRIFKKPLPFQVKTNSANML